MTVSRLTLRLLLLYVALDFSNPLMPGAVSFDPDDSVEAVRAGRLEPPAAAVAVTPVPAPARVESAPPTRPALRRPAGPAAPPVVLTHLRRTPAPSRTSDRSEDH
ncbi:MAG: hypothetical protein HYS37_12045 [Candidatus Rokubacteria bacterium]|nr:hypothetical protein [Candidatus Rokubacteria bacterium]